MGRVPLVNGGFALVDDADLPLVQGYRWRRHDDSNASYAVTEVRGARVLMHRLIMGPPRGRDVDHINRDGLDNRRDNLRVCTRGQNCANSATPKTNTSGYKGVSFHSPSGKWLAAIRESGGVRHLGLFEAPEDAARAYNAAAAELRGEFARGNQLPETGRLGGVEEAFGLTPQEGEVARLIADRGFAIDQVADALRLTVAEVRGLTASIREKTAAYQAQITPDEDEPEERHPGLGAGARKIFQ